MAVITRSTLINSGIIIRINVHFVRVMWPGDASKWLPREVEKGTSFELGYKSLQ